MNKLILAIVQPLQLIYLSYNSSKITTFLQISYKVQINYFKNLSIHTKSQCHGEGQSATYRDTCYCEENISYHKLLNILT